MDLVTYAIAAILVASIVLLAVVRTRMRSLEDWLAQVNEESERERTHLTEANAKLETWFGEKTVAETRLQETEKKLATALGERNSAIAERDLAVDRKNEAETQAALRSQQLEGMNKRLEDWETAKAESLQAAKAAVLSTASELSTKLLEDHKRETAEAKKDAEERVGKATATLLKQIEEMGKTVATLNKQVDENRDTMSTVWKALSSPGGAGHYAEIGLENTLKSFGLEKGRDFLIQPQLEGKRLRPDAIVLLPGDTVLVVDSKASKFLLDLAEAEGTAGEEEAYKNLVRTMNQHLKALADKNYKAEILASYHEAGRTGEIKRIMSVMYLPNEGAIEKLSKADPDFIRKAARLEMTIAGPSALTSLIGFARVEIDLGRQIENHEHIVQGTRALLDGIGVVIGHTESVGRGIRSAADHYVKLTGSINSRLLPRVQTLLTQGVRPSRHQRMPKRVPAYQVIQLETGELIEGEAEEVGQLPAVTDETTRED